MKKTLLLFSLILALSFSVNAKKVYIENQTVTASNGCEFTINGWIDVSVVIGWPPINVNSYNITMSGPCGTYHFRGIVYKNEDGGLAIQGELVNLETLEIIRFDEFIEFHEIIFLLENLYGK